MEDLPRAVPLKPSAPSDVQMRLPAAQTLSIRQVPAILCWKNLTVTVTNAKGVSRQILNGVSGYVEPQGMLAIMGASGCGKSTMLDALAGRLAKTARMDGEVLLNGRPQKLSYGAAAYVTQDDVLIGTLTVRESVMYSAKLRLPRSIASEDKASMVDSVLTEMGLAEVANTYIGNWHMRGISGGQKRRVSIAMELVTRPSLLFLDEPTSGLDSASAFYVMATIRKLALHDRTILSVIHQPSSEVFALFDQLCLLSAGRTLYYGDASKALAIFEGAGVPCPEHRNPADHFLRATNKDFDTAKFAQDPELSSMLNSAHELETRPVDEIVADVIRTYQASEQAKLVESNVAQLSLVLGENIEPLRDNDLFSSMVQTITLTDRSFRNMLRNVGLYWLRIAMYIMLMICIGTIYFNVGFGYNSMQARASVLFFIAAFLTFMSIAAFPAFIEDMKVFSRERLNGYYGVLQFVLSNSFSSLPFIFLIAILSSAIGYFLIGLQKTAECFFYFVLCLFFALAVVESLMMAIAAVVPNFLMGIAGGAGILGIFMLTCGFFRLPSDLPNPVWKYPFYYLSFHTYCFAGFMNNEFIGLTFDDASGQPVINGDVALTYYDQDGKNKWIQLLVLGCMIVIYRAMFFGLIKLKEHFSTWDDVLALFTRPSSQPAPASEIVVVATGARTAAKA